MSALVGGMAGVLSVAAAEGGGVGRASGAELRSCRTAGGVSEGISAAGSNCCCVVVLAAFGVGLVVGFVVVACCLNFSFSSGGSLEYSSHYCFNCSFFSAGSCAVDKKFSRAFCRCAGVSFPHSCICF